MEYSTCRERGTKVFSLSHARDMLSSSSWKFTILVYLTPKEKQLSCYSCMQGVHLRYIFFIKLKFCVLTLVPMSSFKLTSIVKVMMRPSSTQTAASWLFNRDQIGLRVQHWLLVRLLNISKQWRFQSPHSFVLFTSRQGKSRNDIGMWRDNLKHANCN